MNAALSTALAALSQQWSGVHIMPLDVHALYAQMMTSPGTFGFTDVTDSAVGNTVFHAQPPSSTSDIWKTNPSALLFWDSIHPTTAGHQIIADYAMSVLNQDLGLPNTLTVSNLNDGGIGSLRYELALAGNGATIVFAPGLQGTITLTSGELRVGQNVTIEGPGADSLTINGNQASRVFEVLGGADVTLSGVTVTDGVANAAGSGKLAGNGGGIAVDPGAVLVLTDSVVTGNTANAASATSSSSGQVAGQGGGIWSYGTLTLRNDNIQDNTANAGSALGVLGGRVSAAGGGVFNGGTLSVTDTTIADNIANAGTSSFLTDAQGGGIYTAGLLSLNTDVVTGNIANAGTVAADRIGFASGRGGGLFVFSAARVNITGSIFADNTGNAASASAANEQLGAVDVQGAGGGVFSQGMLTVSSTFFSGNVANAGSASAAIVAGVTGYGGGIDNLGGQLTVTAVDVANNVANAGSAHAAAIGSSLARGLGGGIYSSTRITVASSHLDANTANSGSAAGIDAHGGGIYDQSALGMSDSSVTNNMVSSGSAAVLTASGGGLWVGGGTITDSGVSDNIVNSGSGIRLLYLSGGAIYDSGKLTVSDGFLTFNNLNTDPGQGAGVNRSSATGGGIEAAGATAFVTLNSSSVAANYALDKVNNIHLSGGQVDPASANNFIGMGGSGGLVNGVNGNVVIGP
jgi:hypothetical protein